jgi:hypothetical protein
MKRASKYDNLLNPINQKKIDDLCQSISENFTHKELIALFQLYKQTTPMAFIKHARLLRKIDSPVFPQNQLFPKLLNKKDQSE